MEKSDKTEDEEDAVSLQYSEKITLFIPFLWQITLSYILNSEHDELILRSLFL